MISFLRMYLELSKIRIVLMVLVVTFFGFYLASKGNFDNTLLSWTLWGTYFLASGSSILNHYMERDTDALMLRTRNRPLPTKQISPLFVLFLGIFFIFIGALMLGLKVNIITMSFALLAAFIYNMVYTPMKRISCWNTFIGSIPGALPPLWGWTAVTGEPNGGGIVLFLILVAWQQPHFFAIAWLFKDDYKRADLKMLPVIDPEGQKTFRMILLFSLLLIPVSLLPVTLQMVGELYFFLTFFLGIAFFLCSMRLAGNPSDEEARKLLLASVLYLPLLLCFVLGDCLL
ncbi:protoheme IX farnesyltransferase [PVC group bacterium (ex Bugula neritina AB1)]|nr:protoheme IX farnesyltransferase [PVC group bacterium (ex Bugula neritina AB1)]